MWDDEPRTLKIVSFQMAKPRFSVYGIFMMHNLSKGAFQQSI